MGLLSTILDLNTYLEITTNTTGGTYAQAQDLSFETCMRLVYRTSMAPDRDGLPIDFASETDDIEPQLAEIRRRGLTFDLVFLDAHHTYACAARDIAAAYSLLGEHGVLVVHDCNPPNRQMAAPDYFDGSWCGVTYKSFIDFCLGNPSFDFLTFDADFGCGIIMKPRGPLQIAENKARARRDEALLARWSEATRDYDTAYAMFRENRQALLHLVDFAGLRARLAPRLTFEASPAF